MAERSRPREAMLWSADNSVPGAVRCSLCGHRCRIEAGKLGLCRVRRNDGGRLMTLNFGSVVAMNPDPIEKKPLLHFLPGSHSLSIAAPGCNFRCAFCQNWQISQSPRDGGLIEGRAIAPETIADAAVQAGCASISYTYTEPTIFFELAWETILAARERGLKNCFVSNGYLTPEAVEKLSGVLDAINVDLKAFRDETYRRVMGARLEPVLECLRRLVSAGVWVEVTTLVVPGMNDSREELGEIAEFIAADLGRHVPWHVSRFHGDYRMSDGQSTPLETLEMACRLAAESGLRYVYCGNVPGGADESTYCPGCGAKLIERTGFRIRSDRLRDGACPDCGQLIEGVWK